MGNLTGPRHGFILISRPEIPLSGLDLSTVFALTEIFVATTEHDCKVTETLGNSILGYWQDIVHNIIRQQAEWQMVSSYIHSENEYYNTVQTVLRGLVKVSGFINPSWSVGVRVVSCKDSKLIQRSIATHPYLNLNMFRIKGSGKEREPPPLALSSNLLWKNQVCKKSCRFHTGF